MGQIYKYKIRQYEISNSSSDWQLGRSRKLKQGVKPIKGRLLNVWTSNNAYRKFGTNVYLASKPNSHCKTYLGYIWEREYPQLTPEVQPQKFTNNTKMMDLNLVEDPSELVQVGCRLTKETHAYLRLVCEKHRISPSTYIEKLIQYHKKHRGADYVTQQQVVY